MNSEAVIFRVLRNKGIAMPEWGSLKPYTIDGFQEIIDPREGKSGRCFIRYIPGEQSVFVDEQKAEWDYQKVLSGEHKIPAIEFSDGRRVCAPDETLLTNYLRVCRQNVKNAAANGCNSTQFVESSSSDRAVEQAAKWKEDGDLTMKIRTMSFAQAKAIYRIMSGKTVKSINETEPDVILHHLGVMAKKDTPKFKELVDDRLLAIKYDIYECLDSSIINRPQSNEYAFMMTSTNQLIKKAPEGSNPITYLAEWLDMDGRDTLDILHKKLNRNPNDEVAVETPVQSAKKMIEFMRNHERGDELFAKKGVSSREFVDEDGNSLPLGNSEKKWVETLVENEDLRLKALARHEALKKAQ